MKSLRNRCKGKKICITIFAAIIGVGTMVLIIAMSTIDLLSGITLVPFGIFINLPYWLAISGFKDVCDTVEDIEIEQKRAANPVKETPKDLYVNKFAGYDTKPVARVQFESGWLCKNINTNYPCDDQQRLQRNRFINQVLNAMLGDFVNVPIPHFNNDMQEEISRKIISDYENEIGSRPSITLQQAVKVIVFQLFQD